MADMAADGNVTLSEKKSILSLLTQLAQLGIMTGPLVSRSSLGHALD